MVNFMQSYFELVTYCVYGVFDDIDKLRFSFKINMLLQEIEIKYRNLKYYTSIKGQKYYHRGISLDNEQFEKLKTLLNVDILTKEYEKSKEDRNMFFTVSDLCESKLKLFGSDIILEINSSDNNPFHFLSAVQSVLQQEPSFHR